MGSPRNGGISAAGGGLARIYAALATGCGYSYRAIDEMYLAEAEEIFDYWQDHPPTYQMLDLIARMLGWEGPERRAEDDGPIDEASYEISPELAAAIGKAAGVPPLAVSLDEMRERSRKKRLEIAGLDAAA